MYAIIYWAGKKGVFPLLVHDNKRIKLFKSLKKADEAAYTFERYRPDAKCRVISVDGVKDY